MKRRVIVTIAVLGGSLIAAGVARADYTGSVDPGSQTVTLSGAGPVVITTSGGVLQHNNLGAGFAGPTDFDSSQPGVQTVPDTGGWTVNVTGSGSDSLEIDEGEATDPVAYASGHTFTPGGTPCIVRDPNDRMGLIDFSEHRAQETWFCYPAGVGDVTVRAGTGSAQFGVLDTQPGVPLHFYGGSGLHDTMQEALNTPTSVGGYHEPMSPVYFAKGSHPAQISYEDGPTTNPATYTIGNGEMVRAGMPPLFFTAPGSALALYPQTGRSTIDIGPTGGDLITIFGNFFGQTGPDLIDGRKADAQTLIYGSLGNDTIYAGPLGGGFVVGGGGNPTIYADANNQPQEVACAPNGHGKKGTAYVTHKDKVLNCKHVHYVSPGKHKKHKSRKGGK
jgi:hypothetical protein